MKHHHDLVGLGDPEGLRQPGIENVFRLHHLDFQVVVSGTEGPDLLESTLDGLLADLGSVGSPDASSLFRAIQVLLPSVAIFDTPVRSLFDDATKFILRDIDEAAASHSRGNAGKKPVHQLPQLRFDFLVSEVRKDEAHAAVDVKTDAARGDDPCFEIHGGHAANGESIAPMTVGHTIGIADNTGQGRHVGHLVDDAFIHVLHELLRGVDPSGNPHSFLIGRGDFPNRFGNSLEVFQCGHKCLAFYTALMRKKSHGLRRKRKK